MPIFARTKLLIHDFCLFPLPSASFSYSGPNPQNSYEYMKKLFSTVFTVSEKEIQEREFRWDRSGAEEIFHVRWEIIKDLDQFTFMHIVIGLDGTAKPSKEFGKEGAIKVTMEGRIRTEYPQETIWQRSLLYEMFRVFYHKVIYDSTRKKYIEECRAMIGRFGEELRAFFNLLTRM